MKWTTSRGRRPIGAKSNSCDGATGSSNALRENTWPARSRANRPALFCAAWIFAIRLASVFAPSQDRRRSVGDHFYFFLPVFKVGCQPPVFWLGAAAMTLIFSFLGFFASRLLRCSPLAMSVSPQGSALGCALCGRALVGAPAFQ